MKQTDFEPISRRTFNLLSRIRDAESLTRWACELLDGAAAVLLRVESDKVTIAHQTDRTAGFAAERHLPVLRDWYAVRPLPRGAKDGISLGRSLKVGEALFGDAAVVFSRPAPADGSRHELIVLGKEGAEPFSSYHCWAGAVLLDAYEREIRYRRILDFEKAARDRYANILSEEFIPEERWDRFVERGDKALPPGADRVLFFGEHAVYWTAARARADRKPLNKQAEGGRHSEPPREPRDTARKWFDANYPDHASDEPHPGGAVGPRTLAGGLLDALCSDSLSKSVGVASMADNVIKLLGPRVSGRPDPDDDEIRKLRFASLALEHGLRLLHQQLSDPARATNPPQGADLAPYLDATHSLLGLAARLARWLLDPDNRTTRPPDGGAGGPSSTRFHRFAPHQLDREILRLYFVDRIAHAGRVRERYLGVSPDGPNGDRDGHHAPKPDVRHAPGEVRRAVAVSAVRYLTWISGLIQDRLGPLGDPHEVSASEVLDAQLHLVDRFTHVELKVDERIGVRALLGGTIEHEAQHYLSGSYYRDHLLHVMDVFLLGDLILRTELTWLGSERRTFADHLCHLTAPHQPRQTEDYHRLWAIAALLHDVGYQLLALRRLATDDGPPPWTRFFRLPGRPENHSLQPPETGDETDGRPDQLPSFAWRLREAFMAMQVEGWLPEIPDPQQLRDHGVLSALRVAQLAAYFDEKEHRATDHAAPGLLAQLQEPLHAIAHHNLPDQRVSLARTPLACLLRLCDELQEWGRKRVNAEKVLRNLYLDILDLPGASREALRRSEQLRGASANIDLVGGARSDGPVLPRVGGPPRAGDRPELPRLAFTLRYADPIEGAFDPTLTLLNKAYNLQHLDLSVEDHEGHKDLQWCVELVFSRPAEYGVMSEYDFYGLFAEEVRVLPLLHTLPRLDETSEAGMVHIDGDKSEDRFGIVLSRRAGQRHRHGWLAADPRDYYKAFQQFKERLSTTWWTRRT